MFRPYTLPMNDLIELSEDVADDMLSKVFDLPSIFYPSIAIAVCTSVLYNYLPISQKWQKVCNALDDHLEFVFSESVQFNGQGECVSINEDFPIPVATENEMEVVIKHLTETIIDGMFEYALETRPIWQKMVEVLERDFSRLPKRPNLDRDDVEIRLLRKVLNITTLKHKLELV